MLSIRPGDLQDLELPVIDVFMLFDEVSRISEMRIPCGAYFNM
jgi:hypothetical protein